MKYDIFENIDELDLFMNDYKYIIINVSAAGCKPCKAIASPGEEFIKKMSCDEHFIFMERGVMTTSFAGADLDKLFSLIRDFVTKNNNSFVMKDDF